MRSRHLPCALLGVLTVLPDVLPAQEIEERMRDLERELGTYHAVLIGINYLAPPADEVVGARRWQTLNAPWNDVQRIRTLLKERYGFTVDVLTDAVEVEEETENGKVRKLVARQSGAGELPTAERITRAFKDVGGLVPTPNNLLIYFAGHGDVVSGTGYWIPCDGRWGHEHADSWISEDVIQAAIANHLSKIEHVLVVSDSCFSGALNRSGGEPNQAYGVDYLDYLSSAARLSSRQVFTSGGLQPVSDAGGGDGMSLFAFWFHKVLDERTDRFVRIFDVADEVAQAVYARSSLTSRQRPELERLRLRGESDERGEFIFVRRDDAATALQPPGPERIGRPGERLPLDVGIRAAPDESAALRGPGPPKLFEVSTGAETTEMVLVTPPEKTRLVKGADRFSASVRRSFLVDRHEVTVARFRRFLEDDRVSARRPLTWDKPGFMDDDQPVVGVDLETARQFAQWAGKDLPTGLEWEYAASWVPGPAGGVPQIHDHPWLWNEELEARWDAAGQEGDPAVRYTVVGIVPMDSTYPPRIGEVPLDVTSRGIVGMGSGVFEWCMLPPEDLRSARLGEIRGAAHFGTGLKIPFRRTNRDLEVVPASTRRYDLGFRCIIRLVY